MKYLVILLAPLVLLSCDAYFPHVRVVRANYSVSRGEYQPAIVDYLRAQEAEEYEAWLSYNLGNVYHFLGESGAAVERWERARESDVDDLIYGASFNQGVYLYEQGRYEAALEQFTYALRVNPGGRAAKINVELTLEKIAAGQELDGGGGQTDGAGGGAGGTEDGGATRMLDYIRRKEEQRWRANSETMASPQERDW